MRALNRVLFALLLLSVAITGPVSSGEIKENYDFVLDQWQELDVTDGSVTVHRIRVDRKEDRLTKSALARPHNQEYLEPVRVQVEYTNGTSQKWRARITVHWMDEEGRIIDGFSANETFQKKSARKVAQASVSTLKYGLERAHTLAVEVRFEP